MKFKQKSLLVILAALGVAQCDAMGARTFASLTRETAKMTRELATASPAERGELQAKIEANLKELKSKEIDKIKLEKVTKLEKSYNDKIAALTRAPSASASAAAPAQVSSAGSAASRALPALPTRPVGTSAGAPDTKHSQEAASTTSARSAGFQAQPVQEAEDREVQEVFQQIIELNKQPMVPAELGQKALQDQISTFMNAIKIYASLRQENNLLKKHTNLAGRILKINNPMRSDAEKRNVLTELQALFPEAQAVLVEIVEIAD